MLAVVRIGDDRSIWFVQEINRSGLAISGHHPCEVGSELLIELSLPQEPAVLVTGCIVWLRNLPLVARHKYSIGLRVIDPPPEYLAYAEKMRAHDAERREHPRFKDVLEVYSDDVLDLLEAATADVAARGLYVRTRHLLEAGQQINLKLCGKELDPVHCLADVVSSFLCDEDNLDHPYGAGVRILEFPGNSERSFAQYLAYLRALYEFE